MKWITHFVSIIHMKKYCLNFKNKFHFKIFSYEFFTVILLNKNTCNEVENQRVGREKWLLDGRKE